MTNVLHQPRSGSREGRISLLREIAAASLAGRRPSREAELWLGAALASYFADPGPRARLEAHLRIAAPKGSHRTPHVLMRDDDTAPEIPARSARRRKA